MSFAFFTHVLYNVNYCLRDLHCSAYLLLLQILRELEFQEELSNYYQFFVNLGLL